MHASEDRDGGKLRLYTPGSQRQALGSARWAEENPVKFGGTESESWPFAFRRVETELASVLVSEFVGVGGAESSNSHLRFGKHI